MKDLDKDILKEIEGLKEMPFCTPEEYFDKLKLSLKTIPEHHSAPAKVLPWRKFTRIAAIAAAIASLITIGTIIGNNGHEYDYLSEEDYIVYSDEMTSTILMDYEQYAEAGELTIDDIIEYLIYIGAEIEDIENY